MSFPFLHFLSSSGFLCYIFRVHLDLLRMLQRDETSRINFISKLRFHVQHCWENFFHDFDRNNGFSA